MASYRMNDDLGLAPHRPEDNPTATMYDGMKSERAHVECGFASRTTTAASPEPIGFTVSSSPSFTPDTYAPSPSPNTSLLFNLTFALPSFALGKYT